MSDLDYAGDLSPKDTWKTLETEKDSFLVDCRTSAEWGFVGVPSLDDLGKKVIFLEWQKYPDMQINDGFLQEIVQSNISKSSTIIFLCRSGARSRSAAEFMTSLGYKNCFNCLDGFEGDHNKEGHRGNINGWKFDKLPWKQG